MDKCQKLSRALQIFTHWMTKLLYVHTASLTNQLKALTLTEEMYSTSISHDNVTPYRQRLTQWEFSTRVFELAIIKKNHETPDVISICLLTFIQWNLSDPHAFLLGNIWSAGSISRTLLIFNARKLVEVTQCHAFFLWLYSAMHIPLLHFHHP